MKGNVQGKIFRMLIIAVFAITIMYLLVDIGNAPKILNWYAGLSGDSTSSFTKKLQFLQEYTTTTGDLSVAKQMGYTDDDIAAWSPDTGNGGANGEQAPLPTSGDSLLDFAKIICSSYLINGNAYYVSSTNDANWGVSYDTINVNGISIQPYKLSGGVYCRCCNGLSSALLRLSGKTQFRDGSNIGYMYIGCNDFWNKVGTVVPNVSTAGQLEVGDVLCVISTKHGDIGHVETVVAKDNKYVYIASAGSSNGISSCASIGYQRKFEFSKDLNTYYSTCDPAHWSGLKGVVRP